MQLFETLGLNTQKPFLKHVHPQSVPAAESNYQDQCENPKWTRPQHQIEKNKTAQNQARKNKIHT